jgi:hypothetical protein
MQNKKPLI